MTGMEPPVDTADITRLLFVRDQPAVADLALVFGHSDRTVAAARVRHAAGLHAAGFVPKLLVSGGATSDPSESEANHMARVARSLGIPDRDVLIESCSRTTAENVTRAAALLRGLGVFDKLATVILVSCGYHLGRARTLARQAFPPAVRFLCCPHPGGPAADDWALGEDARALVLSEYRLYRQVARADG
jgi:uncharacterized SAM-binding protein YcdF (DUF218 family)